jgi:hypothetical protein
MGWKLVRLIQFNVCWVFCAAGATTLSVTPAKVHAGGQVKVAWQASAGTQVVWLGVGPMPPSGQRQITPTSGTVVPFLFEKGDRLEFLSRVIEVLGVRGNYDLPKREQYLHPFSDSVPAIAFTTLCQRVMSMFQHELKFDKPDVWADLDGSGEPRNLYFQTGWRRLPELQKGLKPGVEERLCTYLLRLDKPKNGDRKIMYEIRSRITNRHESDADLELEDQQALYDSARQLLATRLGLIH